MRPLISSSQNQIAGAGLTCRICGDSSARVAGQVEYYAGFPRAVHDCPACGCRFTDHDNSIYDVLHASGAVSYYNDYRDLAAQCKALFDRHDLAGLTALLGQISKYRFILDEVSRTPSDAKILEVGCSRGYLTSASILAGRNIVGADISPAALEGARAAFGDHFVRADGPEIAAGGPYDLIYHVGMIGCVSDPVGLTRGLLAMLKPGGSLVFNAPNLRGCYLRNQLWLDSAPPPDVVTLFPPGFWSLQLPDLADVCETEEMVPVDLGVKVGLRKLFGVRWNQPKSGASLTSSDAGASTSRISGRAWDIFERAVTKGTRLTGLSRFAAQQPAEFGLFVRMTKTPAAVQQSKCIPISAACST